MALNRVFQSSWLPLLIVSEDCGWSPTAVGEWVNSLGLKHHAHKFVQRGVTACDLPSLTHAILQEQFGISRFAERHQIMNQVVIWNYQLQEQHDHEAAGINGRQLLLTCGHNTPELIPDGYEVVNACTGSYSVPGTHILSFPIASGSITELTTLSVLQKYSHRLIDSVLAEWWRILAPNGRLVIADIPDLGYIAKQYLQDVWDAPIAGVALFGLENEMKNGSDFNFMSFDAYSIRRRLDRMGFHVESISSSLQPISDTQQVKFLRVNAMKIGNVAPTAPAPAAVSLLSYPSTRATGKVPHPLPNPLALNLGCGNDVREGFVNIDLFASDPRVVSGDVYSLPFPDQSADFIVASDILEHFSYHQSVTLLREWRRVLKPEGILQVRCPQFQRQMEAYNQGTWDADIASVFIFAGQTSPGDFHMVGFDRPFIDATLAKAGLAIVEYIEPPAPQTPLPGQINMMFNAKKVEGR